MSHNHDMKKTHISFVEFDDVHYPKLAKDKTYFGEKNSKERVIEFDFEYCINCDLRLLNGKPIMTKNILEEEFERFVTCAKNNYHVPSEKVTVQHSDFETLQRLIKNAIEFGKLKENLKQTS